MIKKILNLCLLVGLSLHSTIGSEMAEVTTTEHSSGSSLDHLAE
jgi:hypothetical protein